jgi:hypothetical protein
MREMSPEAQTKLIAFVSCQKYSGGSAFSFQETISRPLAPAITAGDQPKMRAYRLRVGVQNRGLLLTHPEQKG